MGVNLEYYKSNLTLDNIKEYKLFLLVRRNSLSFFILHSKDLELVYFKNELFNESFESSFRALYATDSVLSKFKELELLGLHTSELTLIPERLYSEEKRSAYFKDLMDLSERQILTSQLPDEETRILYLVEQSTVELLEEYFEIGETVPNFQGLIRSAHQNNKSYNLVVQLDHEELTIFYTEEGKIKFLNKFEFKSTADVLYYLLKVCAVLKLDTKKLSLDLTGHIGEDSEIYRTLHKYIFELRLLKLEQNINIPLSDSEIHYFNDIFALLKK